jgi:hypothetical protein
VESYAGFTGESTILENLYHQTVKEENQLSLPALYLNKDGTEPSIDPKTGKLLDHKSNLKRHTFENLEVYANPQARIFTLWNTKPRLPWQTPQYYRQEQAAIPNPQEYNRVHKNQWASATAKFVDDSHWQRCLIGPGQASTKLFNIVGSQGVAQPSEDPLIVGIDAAVTNDNFAIVTVSRIGDTAYVRDSKLYIPPKGKGEIDFSQPEFYLRRMTTPTDEFVSDPEKDGPLLDPDTGAPSRGWGLNVVYFVYDPFQMAEMSQRLKNQGAGAFLKLGQNGPRAEADSLLQKLIFGTRIKHDGSHTELTQHIKNANAKVTGAGKQIRIEKRNPHLKIDLAVALSMACWIAFDLNLG